MCVAELTSQVTCMPRADAEEDSPEHPRDPQPIRQSRAANSRAMPTVVTGTQWYLLSHW